MLRGEVAYLDNNAWQTLSQDAVESLCELERASCLFVALSVTNLIELPLRDDESQTRKRTQTAKTMLKAASPQHFLRPKTALTKDETRVGLRRRGRAAIFAFEGTSQHKRYQEILDGFAGQNPRDPDLLKDLQVLKDKAREEYEKEAQDTIATIAEGKETEELSFSEEDIAELVCEYHPTVCRRLIHRVPGGQSLIAQVGVEKAVARIQSVRVYAKLLFFRLHHQAQWSGKTDKGDYYDTDQVLYGSYCDAFVTEERRLRRFCARIAEPTLRSISLSEFVAEVEDLRKRCL